jgi:nitroreductase
MSRVDNETLFQQMNWRYACKKFDPSKVIREADWNILAETLRLTASSYGLQPWKFIVVQNPETRKKLFEAAWKQTPVVDASHFVVITYKEKMDEEHITRHVEQTAKLRGIEVSTLARMKEVAMRDLVAGPMSATIDTWAMRQCYIAMGSFLTTAALMEIDTLPMEGLDPVAFDKILNLEGTGFKTVAAIACGYRAPDDKYATTKKIRFDMKDVVVYK